MPWLPTDFDHPTRLDLGSGFHLRPIAADDVDIDHPAVLGSRDRLWSIYGAAWGWPPATMTVEQDRDDLAHHAEEIAAHIAFNYAVLDAAESQLVGCVYIDPAGDAEPDVDAVVSWWVIDELVGSELERELGDVVPEWLTTTWGFGSVRYGV